MSIHVTYILKSVYIYVYQSVQASLFISIFSYFLPYLFLSLSLSLYIYIYIYIYISPLLFIYPGFFISDDRIGEKLTVTKNHWLCVYSIQT